MCIMDWTTIFLESGEEELLGGTSIHSNNSPTISRKTRLSRLVSSVYEDHHRQEAVAAADDSYTSASSSQEEETPNNGYTLHALYFLSINYILGVGVCGVPYAFSKSGWLLGSVLVIIVSLISYITVMWIAETSVRAEMIIQHRRQQQLNNNSPSDTKKAQGTNEKTPLLVKHSTDPSCPLFEMTTTTSHSFEVMDLVKLFLGPIHYNLYQISLLALMFIGLLAYTQVFCVTVGALLFHEETIIPLLVFSAIVIPLSCIELEEQLYMQAVLSIMRFVIIFAMILASAVGLFYSSTTSASSSLVTSSSSLVPVDFSGFGVAFSTALFSQLFQHSVPGLIRPLSNHSQSKRKKIRSVFGACLFTTCSLYLLLGITASLYFLNDTNPSVNLNFVRTTTMMPSSPLADNVIISFMIVLFPALDTLSVFPLVAITLGNNLFAAAAADGTSTAIIIKTSNRILSLLENNRFLLGNNNNNNNNTNSTENNKKKRTVIAVKMTNIFFRRCAAIPPLLGSLVASDLSFSLQLAGVAGLYVAFVAPCLLQRNSSRMVETYCGSTTTIYSGWYSKPNLIILILCFAAFSFAVVSLQIIRIL